MQNDENHHSIKNFFVRFNAVVFIVILVSALIFCVTILDEILNKTSTTTLSSSGIDANQTKFDDATKAQLSRLKTSSENSGDQTLPSGRINPFSE